MLSLLVVLRLVRVAGLAGIGRLRVLRVRERGFGDAGDLAHGDRELPILLLCEYCRGRVLRNIGGGR
jgi:hypothetical protein